VSLGDADVLLGEILDLLGDERLDFERLDSGERNGAPLALVVLDDNLPGAEVLDGLDHDRLSPVGIDGEDRSGPEDAAIAMVASPLGGDRNARSLRRLTHTRLPSAEVWVVERRLDKECPLSA